MMWTWEAMVKLLSKDELEQDIKRLERILKTGKAADGYEIDPDRRENYEHNLAACKEELKAR